MDFPSVITDTTNNTVDDANTMLIHMKLGPLVEQSTNEVEDGQGGVLYYEPE